MQPGIVFEHGVQKNTHKLTCELSTHRKRITDPWVAASCLLDHIQMRKKRKRISRCKSGKLFNPTSPFAELLQKYWYYFRL